MRSRALLLTGILLCAGQPLLAAMSKSQLLQLVDKGVDASLIAALVAQECIDFEMTAEVLMELSPKVPKEVLQAALSCKGDSAAAEDAEDAEDASAPPSTSALRLSQITVLAVIPATLDGDTDVGLTAAIVDELRRQRPRYTLIDSLELAGDFEEPEDREDFGGFRGLGDLNDMNDLEDLEDFNSETPIQELLEAARSQGAHGLVLVRGSEFHRIEDPGIRLEVKIVEANQGRVVWTGRGSGLSNLFSRHAAKRYAARNTVSTFP